MASPPIRNRTDTRRRTAILVAQPLEPCSASFAPQPAAMF
jgi:hypothetical protein